jgi:AraC-like DNA-binding protein
MNHVPPTSSATPQPSERQAGLTRFETRDQDEVNAFITDTYIGSNARFGEVHDHARFRAATVVTPHLQGGAIRSSIDYGGISDPFDYQLFYICFNGQIRVDGIDGEQRLRPGAASFFALGKPLDFDFRDIGFQLLALPTGHVEQIAQEITDIPAGQVRFDGNEPVSAAAHRRWCDTFAYIRRTLDGSATSPMPPMLTEQLARLLVVTALDTFPNTTMNRHYDTGPGRVAPAATRRAVNYIQAHADQPISLADIAAAAGTTSRALQYAFRRHYDTTPLGYLRSTRLHRAHLELQTASPLRGDTVADIAARWGFNDPDRFTVAYRNAYHQPPSTTLRT